MRFVSGQARTARTAVSLHFCCGHRAISVLRGERVESFITPQLSFHPIERPLLCQPSANCFRGFAAVRRSVLELVIELFVVYIDVFRGSDAVDNQFRFNIIASAFVLAAAWSSP